MALPFMLLSGTANSSLTAGVAERLGAAVGGCVVERFPDGEVRGRSCLIVDDMIATGMTLADTIETLLEHASMLARPLSITTGMRRVSFARLLSSRPCARDEMRVAATHPVFLRGSRDRLEHPAIRDIFVTDTIAGAEALPNLHVVSIAPMLAHTIEHVLRRAV